MNKVEVGFIAYRDAKSKKFTKSEPIFIRATPKRIANRQKFDSSVIDFFINAYSEHQIKEVLGREIK